MNQQLYKTSTLINASPDSYRYRFVNVGDALNNYDNKILLPNIAIETNYVKFSKTKKNHFTYKLERSGDITQPISLVMIADANFNINNIVINMTFVDTLLFSCNLRTLAKFKTNIYISHLSENKQEINVDLPFEWLFGKFMTIKNVAHSPIITIFSSDVQHDIHDIKILYKSIYYEIADRAIIFHTQMDILFQQIESIYLDIGQTVNTNKDFIFKKDVHLQSLMRGFFVEGDNISEISHIDLNLNGLLRQTYYMSDIRRKNDKCSEMYYFPLNDNYNYKTISPETLHGGQCNLGSEDIQMSFSIHFKTKYTDLGIKFLNIHVLSINILKYDDDNNVSFKHIPTIQDLMLNEKPDAVNKIDNNVAVDGLDKSESFLIPEVIEI